MPELRYDPIRWRWSIISYERGIRPSDYTRERELPSSPSDKCFFCEGEEDKTPKEVFSISNKERLPNTPGWIVRVVPNKFPALRIEGNLERKGIGIFDYVSGIGAHEVIIETPLHVIQTEDLPVEHIHKILLAFKARIIDLTKDPRFRYILIFKNHGKEAGASLSHPHSQLIATPIIPISVVTELNAGRQHFQEKERCIFCDLIDQEKSYKERNILITDTYFVWAPYASSFPFETWILPIRHNHQFAECDDNELFSLAEVLKDILGRIKILLKNPPYNLVIHTAPVARIRPGKPGYWETLAFDYHWHIEIVPRITHIAGFEWGSGFYINPVLPEDAARYMREMKEE